MTDFVTAILVPDVYKAADLALEGVLDGHGFVVPIAVCGHVQ